MRKSYSSDVGREQFEEICKELTRAKKITHSRRYDLCDKFCAVLYLLKKAVRGDPFRMIFPNGKTCVIVTIYGQKRKTLFPIYGGRGQQASSLGRKEEMVLF